MFLPLAPIRQQQSVWLCMQTAVRGTDGRMDGQKRGRDGGGGEKEGALCTLSCLQLDVFPRWCITHKHTYVIPADLEICET